MNVPKIIIATGAALALVAAGTGAGASIARISVNSGNPVNDGVINGCYTLKATNGSHHLALQTWGTKCPTGTTKIQWNGQTTVPQRLIFANPGTGAGLAVAKCSSPQWPYVVSGGAVLGPGTTGALTESVPWLVQNNAPFNGIEEPLAGTTEYGWAARSS